MYLYQTESEENTSLSPGDRVDPNILVEVNCQGGYYRNSSLQFYTLCSTKGWLKLKKYVSVIAAIISYVEVCTVS